MTTSTPANTGPDGPGGRRRRRLPLGAALAVLVSGAGLAAVVAVAPRSPHRTGAEPGGGTAGATTSSGPVPPPAQLVWHRLALLAAPPGMPAAQKTIPALGSVSCPEMACVAVGGPFVASGHPGGSWSLRPAPRGTGYLSAVSCAPGAGGGCVAVGEQTGSGDSDLAIWSADAGSSWHAARLPSGVSGLSGVSCATQRSCLAVGEAAGRATVLASSDGGRTWAAVGAPPGMAGIVSVSCSGPGTCAVSGWLTVTQAPVVATTAGGGWQWLVRPALAGVAGLESVSCVSRSVCYVGGFATVRAGDAETFPGAMERTTDGGRTWDPVALPESVGPVTAVSCVSRLSCAAVGASAVQAPHSQASAGTAVVTSDGGRSFTSTALPAHSGALSGLSCAAAGASVDCVATAASAPPSAGPGRPFQPDALILGLSAG